MKLMKNRLSQFLILFLGTSIFALPTYPADKASIFILNSEGKKSFKEYDEVEIVGNNFDPNGNTNGWPVPVPQGVPHGIFVAFAYVKDYWQPSKKAPSDNRIIDRTTMKWVISKNALNKVSSSPFNFQRTIRNQAVFFDSKGNFRTKIIIKKNTSIPPGFKPGIITYAAAGAVNSYEEKFIPIRIEPGKGENHPDKLNKNLVMSLPKNLTKITKSKIVGGKIEGRNRSAILENDKVSFEYSCYINSSKTIKFSGGVVQYARYHLYEVGIKNPWLTYKNNEWILSAEISNKYDSSLVEVKRKILGKVKLSKSDLKVKNDFVVFQNLKVLSSAENLGSTYSLENFSRDKISSISLKLPLDEYLKIQA